MIIWQKYAISVGLSQHASAVRSVIVSDWPLEYIMQNFDWLSHGQKKKCRRSRRPPLGMVQTLHLHAP